MCFSCYHFQWWWFRLNTWAHILLNVDCLSFWQPNWKEKGKNQSSISNEMFVLFFVINATVETSSKLVNVYHWYQLSIELWVNCCITQRNSITHFFECAWNQINRVEWGETRAVLLWWRRRQRRRWIEIENKTKMKNYNWN